MSLTSGRRAALLCLTGLMAVSACRTDTGGENLSTLAGGPGQASANDPVLRWNAVALKAEAADHSGTYGAPDNGGPTRSSRAMAIVHIALYDAVNAIQGGYQPYIPVNAGAAVTAKASVDAAAAQAAHDALAALYPKQQADFDRELKQAQQGIPAKKGRQEGITVGNLAAAHILAQRAADGAADGQTPIYPATNQPPLPGQHWADPLNPGQGVLSPGWGRLYTYSNLDVTAPGVRAPAPPALNSPAYANVFNDVKALGGDGIATATSRTKEQTEIGLFWAYDGTAQLGTPPRLYNQIARVVARDQKNTPIENARLFALVNIAMADSGIACWDSKYYYNLWRPVLGVRYGGADGNPQTAGDPAWTPLGAPASNKSGNNFTPPFPAYPSGHATFGGALFRTLRRFYGTDEIPCALRSDELHGSTTDSQGNHRHSVVRRFRNFTDPMKENARSRIYLGIHWQIDADSGIDMGKTVADHVYDTLLRPN